MVHGSAIICCPFTHIVDEVSVFVLKLIYDEFVLLRIEWISLFFVLNLVVTLQILLINDDEFWKREREREMDRIYYCLRRSNMAYETMG